MTRWISPASTLLWCSLGCVFAVTAFACVDRLVIGSTSEEPLFRDGGRSTPHLRDVAETADAADVRESTIFLQETDSSLLSRVDGGARCDPAPDACQRGGWNGLLTFVDGADVQTDQSLRWHWSPGPEGSWQRPLQPDFSSLGGAPVWDDCHDCGGTLQLQTCPLTLSRWQSCLTLSFGAHGVNGSWYDEEGAAHALTAAGGGVSSIRVFRDEVQPVLYGSLAFEVADRAPTDRLWVDLAVNLSFTQIALTR